MPVQGLFLPVALCIVLCMGPDRGRFVAASTTTEMSVPTTTSAPTNQSQNTTTEEFCPFDSASNGSPCNHVACIMANQSNPLVVSYSCETVIATYCSQPLRTASKDPGCFDIFEIEINANGTSTDHLQTTTGSGAVETTTTPPIPVPATTTLKPEAKVKAKFSMSIGQQVTLAELKTPAMQMSLQNDLAKAMGVDTSTVKILDVYECPGDNRCSARRNRRALSGGRSIVVVFEVIGTTAVAKTAQVALASSSFTAALGSLIVTSVQTNLGKTTTVSVSAPVVTETSIPDDDTNKTTPTSGTDNSLVTGIVIVVVGGGVVTAGGIYAMQAKKERDAVKAKIAAAILRQEELEREEQKRASRSKKVKSPPSSSKAKAYAIKDDPKLPKHQSPYKLPPGKKPELDVEAPKSTVLKAPKPKSPTASRGTAGKTSEPVLLPKAPKSSPYAVQEEAPTLRDPNPMPAGKSILEKASRQRKIAPPQVLPRKVPAIGPGSPISVPDASVVARYRRIMAEKEARQARRKSPLPLEFAVGNPSGDESAGSTVPSAVQDNVEVVAKAQTTTPQARQAERRLRLMEEYKAQYRHKYDSMKEDMKRKHLDELRRRRQQREAAKLLAAGVGRMETPAAPPLVVSAGVSPKASESESQPTRNRVKLSPIKREELMEDYKKEHKAMRNELKERLKRKHLAELRLAQEARKQRIAEQTKRMKEELERKRNKPPQYTLKPGEKKPKATLVPLGHVPPPPSDEISAEVAGSTDTNHTAVGVKHIDKPPSNDVGSSSASTTIVVKAGAGGKFADC
jgi:hypothetical protein